MWIFAVIGTLFLAVGIWHLWWRVRRINAFAPVSATIISVGIVPREFSSPGNDVDGTATFWAPAVEYEYCVTGTNYRSRVFSPTDSAFSYAFLAKIKVRRFSVGQTVTAYYDPQKPADAFLSPAEPFLTLFPFIMAAISFAASVVAASFGNSS